MICIVYVKLFSSLYNGSMRGKSHCLLVFTNLLAHADQYGVADIHPRAIAEEVGLPLDEVLTAIRELEADDPDSRSPEENGKRLVLLDGHRNWGWQIVNFLKYRELRNEEERRLQNREAQRRWRDKQRKPASADVSHDKPPSAHTEAEAEAEAENTGTGVPVLPANELSGDNGKTKRQDGSGMLFAMKSGTFELAEKRLAEYVATYSFDVRHELMKAAHWLRDNPSRRPRASRGMKGFLTSWLNRHDDQLKPSQKIAGRIANDPKLEAELERASKIKRERAEAIRNGQVPAIPTE